MDALRSFILSITEAKVSAEKVEATCNKAAIGLDFPILASSTKAPSTEVGAMVFSFSTIKSRAERTPGPYSYLLAKAVLSASLAYPNCACLSFKIPSCLPISTILTSRALISEIEIPIYSSASLAAIWHVSLFKVNLAISSVHSILWVAMVLSAAVYWAFKLVRISFNILATSPSGELFYI
jgi:hypothetical protein